MTHDPKPGFSENSCPNYSIKLDAILRMYTSIRISVVCKFPFDLASAILVYGIKTTKK